jgi:prepilin-type N-terminal cleavage/methylation domain-containing protein
LRRNAASRGLTLLEVVIALLLFAMISVFLLSGQGRAADAVLRAQIEREVAELLSFRLAAVAMDWKEYEDGDSGVFPHIGASERLVDEEEIFGDEFEGYTWDLEMIEVIGTGATGAVSVDDSEVKNLLFEEEGTAGETDEEEPNVAAEEVDQMLFIRVTVYPPEYDPTVPVEEVDVALRPRSAWTAIYLPSDETEEG